MRPFRKSEPAAADNICGRNLEGVLRTFGNTARYDDKAWGEHDKGANGVRLFYEQPADAHMVAFSM